MTTSPRLIDFAICRVFNPPWEDSESTLETRIAALEARVTALESPPVAGIRVTYLDIYNETDGNYTRYRCRDNADGDPELYVSDTGLS